MIAGAFFSIVSIFDLLTYGIITWVGCQPRRLVAMGIQLVAIHLHRLAACHEVGAELLEVCVLIIEGFYGAKIQILLSTRLWVRHRCSSTARNRAD
jgi:hypothetical protein